MRRLITVLVLLSPAVIPAQDARLELTPTLGYRWGGGIDVVDRAFTGGSYDVTLGDAGAFALVLGIPLQPHTTLELTFDRQDASLEDEQGLFGEQPGWITPPGDSSILDTDVTYYHVGFLREMSQGTTRWFLTASAGVTHFDFAVPLDDDTRLSLSGGGGLKLDLSDRLGLRFGAKVFWTDTDQDTARTQYLEHSDCGATCFYVYRYQNDFIQTELSVGLTISL